LCHQRWDHGARVQRSQPAQYARGAHHSRSGGDR
jgi:hypothetical protein